MDISSYGSLMDEIGENIGHEKAVEIAKGFGFPRADVEEISRSELPGLSLIEKLEEDGIISEDRTDILDGVFRTAGLPDLADLVKQYQPKAVPETLPAIHNQLQDDLPVCSDHVAPCELLCNDCNKMVCFVCSLENHGLHNTVHHTDFQDHARKKIESLSISHKDIAQKGEELRALLENKEAKVNSVLMIKKDLDVYQAAIEKLSQNHIEGLVQELESTSTGHVAKIKTQIEKALSLRERIAFVEKEIFPLMNETYIGVEGLRKVRFKENLVKELYKELQIIQKKMSLGNYIVNVLGLQNNGVFASLSFSKICGGIKVTAEQYIIFVDDRMDEKHIILECVDVTSGGFTKFSHKIPCLDTSAPLAFSNREYVSEGEVSCIVAVGHTVYKADFAGNFSRGFTSVTRCRKYSLQLEEGSFIVSLHTADEGCVFTASKTPVIYFCGSSFDILMQINCSLHLTSASEIACNDESAYLVSDPSSCNVFLVFKQKNSVHDEYMFHRILPSGELEDPFPMSLLFDGTHWIILWVSQIPDDKQQFKWEVTLHQENGRLLRSCEKGNSTIHRFPHSVSRVRANLTVGFTDRSTTSFNSNDGGVMGTLRGLVGDGDKLEDKIRELASKLGL